jgi:hypothetical protein
LFHIYHLYAIKPLEATPTQLWENNLQKYSTNNITQTSKKPLSSWQLYLGTLQWYESEHPCHLVIKLMTKRRDRGGKPLPKIPKEEESKGSMGENHEAEKALPEEATIVAEKVTQTVHDTLQNSQIILQRLLDEMQNHLSRG